MSASKIRCFVQRYFMSTFLAGVSLLITAFPTFLSVFSTVVSGKRANWTFSQRQKCYSCSFISQKPVWQWKFNLGRAHERLQLSSFQTSVKLCLLHNAAACVVWNPRLQRKPTSCHATKKRNPNCCRECRLQRAFRPTRGQLHTATLQEPVCTQPKTNLLSPEWVLLI